MHGLVPNIKMGKLKRKKKNNQEAINEGHKGLQVSMKSQGDEGLLLLFHIETIFLTPNSWWNLLQHILACKQIGPRYPRNH